MPFASSEVETLRACVSTSRLRREVYPERQFFEIACRRARHERV